MRNYVSLILVLSFFSDINAKEEIPVNPCVFNEPQELPVKRTPPVIPAVEYEGEVFTVTTPLVVECVPFTICDVDGAVIYSSTDCAASRSHAFTVTTLTPGDSYTVEVTIGSVTWTGDFTWETL